MSGSTCQLVLMMKWQLKVLYNVLCIHICVFVCILRCWSQRDTEWFSASLLNKPCQMWHSVSLDWNSEGQAGVCDSSISRQHHLLYINILYFYRDHTQQQRSFTKWRETVTWVISSTCRDPTRTGEPPPRPESKTTCHDSLWRETGCWFKRKPQKLNEFSNESRIVSFEWFRFPLNLKLFVSK